LNGNHKLKAAKISLDSVTNFKYLLTIVPYPNYEQVKFGECLFPFDSDHFKHKTTLLLPVMKPNDAP